VGGGLARENGEREIFGVGGRRGSLGLCIYLLSS